MGVSTCRPGNQAVGGRGRGRGGGEGGGRSTLYIASVRVSWAEREQLNRLHTYGTRHSALEVKDFIACVVTGGLKLKPKP